MAHRLTDEIEAAPLSSGFNVGKGPAGLCAAIDIGTSNLRMLTARPTLNGFQVVDAFSRQVRLGEGLWQNQCLRPAAIERAVAALEVCRDRLFDLKVKKFRAIATEACRRAENAADFIDLARDRAGIEIDVIEPGEEAKLALGACKPLLPENCRHAVIFDIGGGSTQIVWASERNGKFELVDYLSIPYGVIRLSDRFGEKLFDRTVFAGCVREITGRLGEFCEANGIRETVDTACCAMVGTSGTVTTLAGMAQRLPRYDRRKVDGYMLEADEIDQVCGEICASSVEGLAAVPSIGPDRADLVVAGCAIFEAIRRRWPIRRVRVADRGLREGILIDLTGTNRCHGAA